MCRLSGSCFQLVASELVIMLIFNGSFECAFFWSGGGVDAAAGTVSNRSTRCQTDRQGVKPTGNNTKVFVIITPRRKHTKSGGHVYETGS